MKHPRKPVNLRLSSGARATLALLARANGIPLNRYLEGLLRDEVKRWAFTPQQLKEEGIEP